MATDSLASDFVITCIVTYCSHLKNSFKTFEDLQKLIPFQFWQMSWFSKIIFVSINWLTFALNFFKKKKKASWNVLKVVSVLTNKILVTLGVIPFLATVW